MSTVILEPNENITDISGTYGVFSYNKQCQIATIKIHTSCCPDGYGPFGEGRDVSNAQSFSTESPGYVVVGFFVSASQFLDSIGTYVKQDVVEKCGPWGSQSPTNRNLKLGACETIKQVNIRAASIVDGIGFDIANSSGQIATTYFGGNGGEMSTVILGPNEQITHISGTYGVFSYNKLCQIATIKIHTNCLPDGYGPFGKGRDVSNAQSFSTKNPGYVVVGFFGRASQFLDSIGAYVKPCGC